MKTNAEKMPDVDPIGKTTEFFFGAGVVVRQSILPAGSIVEQHVHDYDHLSILGRGRVFVYVDNDQQCYVAPACIEIKKGKKHSVFALEDSTWFCIHPEEI